MNRLECIICNGFTRLHSKSSYLELPVYHCVNCDFYISGESYKERKTKTEKIYRSKHWGSKNIWDAKKSIETDYTDLDSQGKKRSWISQLLYCKPYLENKREILEIGSGQGQATYWFDKEGFLITGVEPDENNVRLINKKLKHGKCIISLAEEFQIDKKFDIIWMSHVLEHLLKPDIFLRNIKNNLKKDGIFFIEVPNCENKKVLTISINKVPHTFHFSKKALIKIVKKEKYNINSVDYFRPATKLEGLINKISRNKIYHYYPRIKTTKTKGTVLRIILTS